MLVHAAPRADALPHRRHRPHHVRSGAAASPGDPRRWLRREEESAQRPGPLQRILVGLRVLVVDDDADVLELFELALTACGADVTATNNARDAIALAARMRPHVIVSDIAMVGEDGYWLVRELKRLPTEIVGDVPVVAVTAYGREHPRARVLAAGFVDHLQKPIDPEQLCRVVARAAGR